MPDFWTPARNGEGGDRSVAAFVPHR